MRLPDGAHSAHRWRIHELTRDFDLEDVWALPTRGGPDDFPRLVEVMGSLDPSKHSKVVNALFELRWKIGGVMGWDDPGTGLGSRVTTLRDRLPDDLRGGDPPPTPSEFPFTPLYITDDEWAGEIANETMHGVMHLSWVQDDDGGHRGQMAVLVKRNGAFGSAYMAAIAPFRHLIVYPLLMRAIEREWSAAAVA